MPVQQFGWEREAHAMLDHYEVPLCGDVAHRINELGQMLRRAVSGDRSLLRAPTPEAVEAANLALGRYAELGIRDSMHFALEAAYAVDGLRGTEDRALREQQNMEQALYEASHDRDLWHREFRALRKAARALLDEEYPPSLIACDRLRRVLREFVEGEQRT